MIASVFSCEVWVAELKLYLICLEEKQASKSVSKQAKKPGFITGEKRGRALEIYKSSDRRVEKFRETGHGKEMKENQAKTAQLQSFLIVGEKEKALSHQCTYRTQLKTREFKAV